MAISGLQLVEDALTACGVLDAGEPLADADAQLALRVLNRMLGLWVNESTAMYELAKDTFALQKGVASYSTSLLASAKRPAAIDSCYLSKDGIDYPVMIVGNTTYDAQSYKSAEGQPEMLYPVSGMPHWTLFFYPVPYADFTGTLTVLRPLTAGDVTLDMVLSLPPGYEEALVTNLAVKLAGMFGQPVTPQLKADAMSSLRIVKRANVRPIVYDNGPWQVTKPTIFTG